MKTRDLIAALQKVDPSGEIEVVVGGEDIHFVEKLPGYWDGCYQVLKRDPTNEYYNIIGAEICSNGFKVKIHPLSIREMLLTEVEAPVTFDSEYAEQHYSKTVKEWREEMRKINEEVKEWSKKRKKATP